MSSVMRFVSVIAVLAGSAGFVEAAPRLKLTKSPGMTADEVWSHGVDKDRSHLSLRGKNGGGFQTLTYKVGKNAVVLPKMGFKAGTLVAHTKYFDASNGKLSGEVVTSLGGDRKSHWIVKPR